MKRAPATRYDLNLAYAASLLVAIVMTIVSVAGLVDWGRVYPAIEAKMLPLFVGQDALNIVVGLPILLGSMSLARRGSLIGLLLWPGALFYVAYDYGYYVLGAPYTLFFLPYLGLVTLSMYAAVAVVVGIDSATVRARLTGAVPARIVGGFLAGIALLFTTLWTALNISAAAGTAPIDPILRVVTIMDLSLQLPALLLGGILLWRRAPIAYVVSAGLLLQAAAYLAGLSAITLLQEALMATPVDPIAVFPGFLVGAIGLVFVGFFVRGAASAATMREGLLTSAGAAQGSRPQAR
jgi:hypothetical protein